MAGESDRLPNESDEDYAARKKKEQAFSEPSEGNPERGGNSTGQASQNQGNWGQYSNDQQNQSRWQQGGEDGTSGHMNPSMFMNATKAIADATAPDGSSDLTGYLNQTEGSIFGNSQSPGWLGTGRRQGSYYRPSDVSNIPGYGGFQNAAQGQFQGAVNRDDIRFDTGFQRGNQQAQTGLIQQLQAAARGEGPSAAQQMMQQAQDRNTQQAMALAASQRGPGAAAAGYNAQANTAMANQQAASDAAVLRAQEQNQAMGLLAQVTGQARGQDIGITSADMQSRLQSQAQRDAAVQRYLQMGMDMAKAQQQADMDMEKLRVQQNLGEEEIRSKDYIGQREGNSEGLGTIGNFIGGMSDERVKHNVEDGDRYVNDFLDKLAAHRYDYKNPEKHGKGKRVSVMAQELEKSELGREFVFDTEDGKAVDYGKGFGVMLAAQAALNKRLKKLEVKKSDKEETEVDDD